MLDILMSHCSNVAIPEATEQAMSYYKSGNVLWILNQAWSFLFLLVFLATGFSGRLGKFSAKIGRNWFCTIAVFITLFTIISQVLSFPLDYYGSFIREHAYGLSNQTFARWFSSWGKSSLLVLVGSIAFIWIFYWLMKKSPRRWWLYGTIASVVILFFLSFIQPIWVEPLFNNYGPMRDKKLEAQILDLASRAGIQGGRVYEVDKSQDTKMLNAYVTGMGSSKRIVLWDTTIERLTPDQILFVMGHEMGHYVLNHIWWGFAFFSLLTLLVFYLTFRCANYLVHKYKKRLGFSKLSEIASFPLLLLVLNFFFLLASPLELLFSRTIEHHADIFGLEITQDNRAAAEAFVVLQEEDLGNPYPGPINKFWRCSHPPLGERIEFCNTYCPWADGEPLKYGKYFE